MSVALKNVAWATAGIWGQQLFAFLTTIFLARLLTPESFGIVATAMLFIIFVQRLLLEGVAFAIVQRTNLTPTYLNSAFLTALAIGAALSLVMMVLAPLVSEAIREPKIKNVMIALAVLPFIEGLACVPNGILRRAMAYRSLAMRTLAVNFLGGVVGIALASTGHGVYSLVAQQIVASSGSAAALYIAANWRPGTSTSKADVWELARFATPMFGSTVLFVATNRLDIIVLSAMFGAQATGAYALAKRIVRLLIDLFISGLNSVSLSKYSEMSRNSEHLGANLLHQSEIVSLAIFPVFFGMAAVSPNLIGAVLEPSWAAAIPVLQILAASAPFQSLSITTSGPLIALGRTRYVFGFNLIGLVVFLLALYVLGDFGATGVALSFAAQSIASYIVIVFMIKHLLQIRLDQYVARIARIALLSLTMTVTTMACQRYLLSMEGDLANLLAGAVIGALVYGVLVAVFLRQTAADAIQQVRSLLKGRVKA